MPLEEAGGGAGGRPLTFAADGKDVEPPDTPDGGPDEPPALPKGR